METPDPARRKFLGRVINSIHALIGGTLGVVFGGAILSPGLATRDENWLSAGRVDALPPDQPTAVTLRIARQDGYAQAIERRVVFLVRNSDTDVIALDSTCTHLGCRVSWNADSQELICPCHGGIYDKTGEVKAGPPPAPLAKLQTRIEGGLVQVQV